MSIVLTQQDRVLNRFANQLGSIGKRDGHKALARAVNRTIGTAFTQTTRAVAKQTSAPLRLVRSQVRKETVRPGGMGALEGKLIATGNPIPLKEFKAKQFSYGVKAKVWGKQQRFQGMFIYAGTFRSGQDVANGHVFQRVTSRSLPIEKQHGPAIPTEIVKGESAEAFKRSVSHTLPKRIEHELGRFLDT